MKTLQEQYNSIKEGKGSKQIFLTEAKKQFPNMLTNPMGFNEASTILKQRGVISENYIDLQPINSVESTPKSSWENKFTQFLAEEKKEQDEAVKAEEKKVSKHVEEVDSHNFDYKDKKNLDNQIGQEVLNGIYFEAKQNPDKSLEEIRDIVSKNLAKDGQYYIKNAAFGVEGLGYQETEVEEVSGKHKSSGYSDKLKKMVKESLMSSVSEGYGAEEYEEGKVAGEKEEKKKLDKKVKKESIDSSLAEIDKQAEIVAMEAKLAKMDEVIEGKLQRINMVSEDANLAELVDKTKLKSMQKEVKVLEKRKAKMEKMYEKMAGKKYQKEEIVGEVDAINESASEDLEAKSLMKKAFLAIKKADMSPTYNSGEAKKLGFGGGYIYLEDNAAKVDIKADKSDKVKSALEAGGLEISSEDQSQDSTIGKVVTYTLK